MDLVGIPTYGAVCKYLALYRMSYSCNETEIATEVFFQIVPYICMELIIKK